MVAVAVTAFAHPLLYMASTVAAAWLLYAPDELLLLLLSRSFWWLAGRLRPLFSSHARQGVVELDPRMSSLSLGGCCPRVRHQ